MYSSVYGHVQISFCFRFLSWEKRNANSLHWTTFVAPRKLKHVHVRRYQHTRNFCIISVKCITAQMSSIHIPQRSSLVNWVDVCAAHDLKSVRALSERSSWPRESSTQHIRSDAMFHLDQFKLRVGLSWGSAGS